MGVPGGPIGDGERRDSPDAPRRLVPIPASQAEFLIMTAARAPSVQNTQPWRFRIRPHAIDLHADPRRGLRVDPAGREMLISCGTALFGLRLGVRSLGYLPVVDLLPDRSQPQLVARVSLGAAEPFTAQERRLLEALPHRHTHRGPFTGEPLPAGLLGDLQHDATDEGATLAVVDRVRGYERLADLVALTGREHDDDPKARADMREWTREPRATKHDGVPASAFAADPDPHRGRLGQRDFDLGRGLGMLDPSGPPPTATAVLLTPGDGRGDWLCAGQALHRLLTRAASRWVFASLYTQPLEDPATRSLITDLLGLAGAPQMILQFGSARSAQATSRRPPADLIDP